MSFPPNLGITNSFLIDSNSSLLFQELPSLLLPHISSPFSKHKMNGYSRIKSKSLDFADLSLTHHTPRSALSTSKFKSNFPKEAKIATNSIPENESDDSEGEVFGIILGRKCGDSKAMDVRSFSIKRSASVSEGYSRIHHQSDLTADENDGDGFTPSDEALTKKKKKKKGKFFRAFRRLFGM